MKEKSKIFHFVILTFGTTLIVLLVLFFKFQDLKTMVQPSIWINSLMLIPGFMTILTQLLDENKEKITNIKKLYVGFCIFIFICYGLTLFLDSAYYIYIDTLALFIAIITFLCGIEFLSDEKENAVDELNIVCYRNSYHKLFRYLLLFIVINIAIYACMIFAFLWFGIQFINIFLIKSDLISIFIFFLLGSLPFLFGEELGWRVFFQPVLQRKYGLLRGGVLHSILWSMWNTLLYLFFIQVDLLDIIGIFVLCIFLNFILVVTFENTKNLLLSVLILWFNNIFVWLFTATFYYTFYKWCAIYCVYLFSLISFTIIKKSNRLFKQKMGKAHFKKKG
ncbi:CPBP family intramembrane glutamic endopeptidase [Eubacterium limosum]|uniref:CPBP family intramembrane glutamic endopeptidase n=1 Tax=Eubacterium limosum TaxID=1736 RepID=UPI001062D076|nr:CPBP family intramembrane glutamic endopeptidase [Eubacterium limosum]